MLEIKGKVNTAVCFARVIEDEAKNLIAILEGRYRSREQSRSQRDDIER